MAVDSPDPLEEAVAVAVWEAELVLDPTSAIDSLPQVTDWHPVMPLRSLGWLSTQLVFHCWHT